MSDELLVTHCAPTLAGLKTGSLFPCDCGEEQELIRRIAELNRRLAGKGLRILPLRLGGGKALIYVYRPGRLAEDLSRSDAAELLRQRGYGDGCPEQKIATLIRRLRQNGEFPHEIGLFLGYPTEDVAGFIRHRAEGCKCVGCWKVYGDEARAKREFAKYRKCTCVYRDRIRQGSSLERLTVSLPNMVSRPVTSAHTDRP